MSKNVIFDSLLGRQSTNLIKPGNKSQFWLIDDPNGKWYDFITNGGKITIQIDNLYFEESPKIFALKAIW